MALFIYLDLVPEAVYSDGDPLDSWMSPLFYHGSRTIFHPILSHNHWYYISVSNIFIILRFVLVNSINITT